MPRSLFRRKQSRRRARTSRVTEHYLAHKEAARRFVHERVVYWNQYYRVPLGRIAIRNQKTCWGSCSQNGNLNFSYRILFLPQQVADYIIVHELCHLKEFNHSPRFWALVAEALPHYKEHKRSLRGFRHPARIRSAYAAAAVRACNS